MTFAEVLDERKLIKTFGIQRGTDLPLFRIIEKTNVVSQRGERGKGLEGRLKPSIQPTNETFQSILILRLTHFPRCGRIMLFRVSRYAEASLTKYL